MNIALILSGGAGIRLGAEIPKQYITVNNRPVISYCMEQFAKHEKIDAIQIVADTQWYGLILRCLEEYDRPLYGSRVKFRGFSEPGRNRQSSVLHGLEDIRNYACDSDIVLVHDAARPLLSTQLITDSLTAIREHEGVLPVLSMKDTIYKSKDGNKIYTLLDRNELYAGQTPETFQLGMYYAANRQLLPDKIYEVNGSTEPAVIAGMDIVMIPGDETNFKITTQKDMEYFRQILCLQMQDRMLK